MECDHKFYKRNILDIIKDEYLLALGLCKEQFDAQNILVNWGLGKRSSILKYIAYKTDRIYEMGLDWTIQTRRKRGKPLINLKEVCY